MEINEITSKLNFKNGEHLKDVFYILAKESAKNLETELGSTQFRKFYDRVLEFNERAKRMDENGFRQKILPLLSLMYSKVNYAKQRKVAGDNFVALMTKSLDKVKSKDDLNNFTLFLEAIIGFMPKNKVKGKR